MKFFKLNSTKPVNVNTSKYLIDWEQKVSGPQKKVKDFLRRYWSTHCVLEEFRIPGSKLRIDLLSISTRVAIEISPASTHLKYNEFMHGSRQGFLAVWKRDEQKKIWIEQNGFKYIELYDDEINNLSKEMFKEKFDLDL